MQEGWKAVYEEEGIWRWAVWRSEWIWRGWEARAVQRKLFALISILKFPDSSCSFRNRWTDKSCPSRALKSLQQWQNPLALILLISFLNLSLLWVQLWAVLTYWFSLKKFILTYDIHVILTTLGHESISLVVRENMDTTKIMVPGDHDRGIGTHRWNMRDFDNMPLACLVELSTLCWEAQLFLWQPWVYAEKMAGNDKILSHGLAGGRKDMETRPGRTWDGRGLDVKER